MGLGMEIVSGAISLIAFPTKLEGYFFIDHVPVIERRHFVRNQVIKGDGFHAESF